MLSDVAVPLLLQLLTIHLLPFAQCICVHTTQHPATLPLLLQGDDVEILIITKDGVRVDSLGLKRD